MLPPPGPRADPAPGGLDDLPQLVDVLRGELSLVGPRPWGPTLAWGATGDLERYADRLRVPGGLTSWVRVDLRGDLVHHEVGLAAPGPWPAVHPGSPDPVLRLDDLTSEHWSWWEDLRIALGALRRAVPPRRGSRTATLTAPGEPPATAGRSATGHELPGLRGG